jgi:hypothetical protein
MVLLLSAITAFAAHPCSTTDEGSISELEVLEEIFQQQRMQLQNVKGIGRVGKDCL